MTMKPYAINTYQPPVAEGVEGQSVIREMRYNTEIKLTDLVTFVNNKSTKLKDNGLKGYFNVTIYDGPAHPFTTKMIAMGSKVDVDENDYVATWILESWFQYVELEPVKKKLEDLKMVQYFNDPKTTTKNFTINFFIQEEDNAGQTKDKYNNCFPKAIRDIIPAQFDKEFKSFKSFKKAFGVDVSEPFPLNKIEEVEERLRVNLPIQGDVVKMSKQNFRLTIPLLFSNGHITVNNKIIEHKKITGISYKERRPLIIHYSSKENLHYCYDGEKEFTKPKQEIRDLLANPIAGEFVVISEKYKDEMKNTFDEFLTEATKLKELTNGKINMFKTGYIKDTIVKLFYDSIRATISSEPIQQDEAQWIINSKRCGLVFGVPHKGKLHKYDYSSYYGSILRSLIDFPVRRGEFKTITQEDIKDIVRYGIYRCVITSANTSAYKTFRFNKLNYYTHIDVKFAKKNGFKVELIQDGYPNFLYYDDTCRVKGSQLFRGIVDEIYAIKKEHPKLSYPKRLLNNLGGALAQFKINKRFLKAGQTSKKTERPEIVIHMASYNNNEMKIETVDVADQFKTNYARMYPFLTAQGRCKIGQLFIDNGVDNFMRVHTDGFVSKIMLPSIKDKRNCDIGELGYEGTGMYEVKNSQIIIKLKDT